MSSHCCSRETLLHDVTCGFKRRDQRPRKRSYCHIRLWPWRNVPPWPVPAACDHSKGSALTNRLTHTAGSIIVNFQHKFLYFLARVSRPAGRSVLEGWLNSGVGKQRLDLIWWVNSLATMTYVQSHPHTHLLSVAQHEGAHTSVAGVVSNNLALTWKRFFFPPENSKLTV